MGSSRLFQSMELKFPPKGTFIFSKWDQKFHSVELIAAVI